MPTRTEIRAALEKVLREVQAASGRPCPPITDDTKPIGDLDAFDSLMAVEATVLVETELNCTLAQGTAFISIDGTPRALTISESVSRIAAMIVPTRAA